MGILSRRKTGFFAANRRFTGRFALCQGAGRFGCARNNGVTPFASVCYREAGARRMVPLLLKFTDGASGRSTAN